MTNSFACGCARSVHMTSVAIVQRYSGPLAVVHTLMGSGCSSGAPPLAAANDEKPKAKPANGPAATQPKPTEPALAVAAPAKAPEGGQPPTRRMSVADVKGKIGSDASQGGVVSKRRASVNPLTGQSTIRYMEAAAVVPETEMAMETPPPAAPAPPMPDGGSTAPATSPAEDAEADTPGARAKALDAMMAGRVHRYDVSLPDGMHALRGLTKFISTRQLSNIDLAALAASAVPELPEEMEGKVLTDDAPMPVVEQRTAPADEPAAAGADSEAPTGGDGEADSKSGSFKAEGLGSERVSRSRLKYVPALFITRPRTRAPQRPPREAARVPVPCALYTEAAPYLTLTPRAPVPRVLYTEAAVYLIITPPASRYSALPLTPASGCPWQVGGQRLGRAHQRQGWREGDGSCRPSGRNVHVPWHGGWQTQG